MSTGVGVGNGVGVRTVVVVGVGLLGVGVSVGAAVGACVTVTTGGSELVAVDLGVDTCPPHAAAVRANTAPTDAIRYS